MSVFHLLPASGIPPVQLHAAFGAAFADYLIGPFCLGLDEWPRFLARQCVDLGRSRVAVGVGGILAFAFVAPRTDHATWRRATMGAVPAGRGSGAAPALLDDFAERARAEGRTQVELECFAQNTRAARLYRGRGFAEVAALHGYQGDARTLAGERDDAGVQELEREHAWQWLADVGGRRDLPLQVTPPSLRAQPVPLRAWRCAQALLVAGESAPGQLTLYSLVDEDPAQQGAQRLVRHLARCLPAQSLHVPQLQRDDLGGGALRRLGLQPLPLHQWLMRRPL